MLFDRICFPYTVILCGKKYLAFHSLRDHFSLYIPASVRVTYLGRSFHAIFSPLNVRDQRD